MSREFTWALVEGAAAAAFWLCFVDGDDITADRFVQAVTEATGQPETQVRAAYLRTEAAADEWHAEVFAYELLGSQG